MTFDIVLPWTKTPLRATTANLPQVAELAGSKLLGDKVPSLQGCLVVVVLLVRTLGQLDLRLPDLFVRNEVEQRRDAVEPRASLVVRPDDMPWRMIGVARLEHRIPGVRIIVPAPERLQIHGAELPLPQRIAYARKETPLLLFLTDFEPKFDQNDPRIDDIFLDFRAEFQEALHLLGFDEAHHIFHAGAVVPAPIEDDDFTGGRKVRDVALYKHLRLFPVGRRRQGHDAENARADP